MAASYLAGEDDKTYTIQTPGGLVTQPKVGAYDAPGSLYSEAKKIRDQQQQQPSGFQNFISGVVNPFVSNAKNTAITALGGTPAQAAPVTAPVQQAAPVQVAPAFVGPPASAQQDNIDQSREPVARSQPAQSSGGIGPGTVQLGSSQEIHERPVIDPGAMKQYEASAREQARHTQNAFDAEGKIAAERGEAAKQQAEMKIGMGQMREEAANKAHDQYLDYQRNYDKLQEDYQKTEIRPAGYFEGNLGANVLSGIGIMLGAVGGALQGTGKNAAVEVIDRAIDRDLQAQKANLDKKREAINVLGARYQAARQAGFDDLQSRMLAKADAYDAIASYTEAKVAPLQGTVIAEKGAAEAARMRTDAAKFRVEATKGSEKTVIGSETKILEGAKPIKLPEQASTDVAKRVNTNDAIQSLREMMTTKKAIDTGYISSAVQELKAKFGVQEADEAKAYQRLKSLIQERINFLTGSGSGVQERADITKTLPGLQDNPDAFLSKLDSLDEANAMGYYRTWERYPNAENKWIDLKGPGADQARITVFGKPTTATKPK